MTLTTDTAYLSWSELKDLPEYSCSVPTGTTLGKVWKRDEHAYARPHSPTCSNPRCMVAKRQCSCADVFGNMCPECREAYRNLKPKRRWMLGEYIPDVDPKMVGIKWRRIVVRLAG